MARRNTKTQTRILEDLAQNTEASYQTVGEALNAGDTEEAVAMAEVEQQIALPRSVVGRKYKIRYRDRAREAGLRGKAAKRSAWDWLAQRMAEQTLTKKAKTDVPALFEFFQANGLDTDRWPNRAPGWEGRLRMTGGLALRRQIAETGLLALRDGTILEVPAEELVRLRTKFDI